MAVSRRLRYEILRRDNHACTYCGATAPDANLTVDHVVPTALGGSDEPSNLTTACADCNSGKSASSPDAPIVASVEQDALRWSKAMQAAAEQLGSDLKLKQGRRQQFLDIWNEWTANATGQPIELDGGWEDAVDRFIAAGLPLLEVREAVRIAMTRRGVPVDATFRYFCGVCWSKITELQERARQVLEAEDQGTDDPVGRYRELRKSFPAIDKLDDEAWEVGFEMVESLPDLDPTDAWYGTGPYMEKYGTGLKHKMLRYLDGVDLSDDDGQVIYQGLFASLRSAWESAREV